jgi:hypothetical protein
MSIEGGGERETEGEREREQEGAADLLIGSEHVHFALLRQVPDHGHMPPGPGLISHDVLIAWFQKVKSPQKSSTYCFNQ